MTAANIIDGVIKLADDGNTASIFSKLKTAHWEIDYRNLSEYLTA